MRERQKREGEGAVTGGEKLQDRGKDGVAPGEKTQGKVRKTKTLFHFCMYAQCYSKGKNPKGVFIENGKGEQLTLDY